MNANDAFEKFKNLFDDPSMAVGYEATFKEGYKAGVQDTLSLQAPIKNETSVQYDSLEIRKAYASIKAEAMSRTELEQVAYEKIFLGTRYTLDSIMIDVIKNKNPNALQYCEKE